jgi:hypothetical protein
MLAEESRLEGRDMHILIDISLINSASLRSQSLSQLNGHNPVLKPA